MKHEGMICPRCGCSMFYYDEQDVLGEHWICLCCSNETDGVIMILPKRVTNVIRKCNK